MSARRLAGILLAAISGLLLGTTTGSFVPADGSLTPDEYRRMGLPGVDRRWSGADHQTALEVLRGLPREALPRAGSVRSAQVFDRLVESLGDWVEFASVHGREGGSEPFSASALYGRSASDDLFFDRECLELLATTAQHLLEELDFIERTDPLLEESTARPESAEMRERRESLRATRPQLREELGRLLVVVLAGLVEIGELPASRPETRLALRDSLADVVPRALHHLPGAADALRSALRTMAASDGNEAIRADIERLATPEVPPAP